MTTPGFERTYTGTKQPQGYPGLPDSWFTQWESLPAADGRSKLFALSHRKKADPVKRVLVIVHGFGEHSGRYQHFPHYLDQSIDAIYVYDHRGHGRSDGIRGDGETFHVLVDDAVLVIRHVEKIYPGAEIHFLGHSMGGLIGLVMGFRHADLPLKTYQISAPYLGLFREIGFPLRAVAGILAKTWGTLSLSTDVDPKVVSRDQRVVENYTADRLNHARMTPRLFASILIAQRDTVARKSGLHYPLVLHLPLADELVSTPVARAFYDSLQNTGKKLFEYPDFRHEPMNDPAKEHFFENMASVIDGSVTKKQESRP